MVTVYKGYSVMRGKKTDYFICPNPPCKYEEVVLYYQEKANIYCEPTICGEISQKKIFKEKDI